MMIRVATIDDAPAMAQVMVDTWLAAHRGQVPEGQWQRRREEWTYADSAHGWRRLLAELADGSNTEDCVYVAVTDEGVVVGVAAGCPAALELLPNAAEVSALYVRPGYQGQGLGRRLVAAIATHQANLGRQALLIGCLATNAPARRFYEALGGQVIGTRQTEDYGFPEPQVVYGWENTQSLLEGVSQMRYNLQTDPVLHALIAEATADPDVIGLVLTGSRAIGGVVPDSDYDVIFVVTDVALTRYQQTQTTTARGVTITPPIPTNDIWHEAPSTLHLDTVVDWMLPAWAESRVLYDRTGETTPLIEALRRMPAERTQQAVKTAYDAYLNGLYRSLKAWRRGNELGARLEAAQTADSLITLLFALEGRWRPYSSRLLFHLDKLADQGWQPAELHNCLLDLITAGDPSRQQVLARRVIALLRARGFGYVYEAWDGQIERTLAWHFP